VTRNERTSLNRHRHHPVVSRSLTIDPRWRARSPGTTDVCLRYRQSRKVLAFRAPYAAAHRVRTKFGDCLDLVAPEWKKTCLITMK